MQQVTFAANRKDLLSALTKMKVGLKGKSGRVLKTRCEITVTDGIVTFIVPGVEYKVNCKTQGGAARASLPYLYFVDVVEKEKVPTVEFRITEGQLEIGILKFRASTCFFESANTWMTMIALLSL